MPKRRSRRGPGVQIVTFFFPPSPPLSGEGAEKNSFTGARTRSRRPCPANVHAGTGKENKKCESIDGCDLIVTLRQNLPRDIEANWSKWQTFQKKFAPDTSLPQQQALGAILLLHHPAQPVRYVIFRSPCQASRCVYIVSVV